MQPLCTSPSHRSHMAASLTLSKKAAALAGKPQASRGREGQAFQSQPVRDTRLRRQNHCLLSQCQPAPPGRRYQWLQAPHPGGPSQRRVCTSGQAAGSSPGALLEHPPGVSLYQFQWGRAGGMQSCNPSGVQFPLPSSRAVLTPAPLPCGDSPDWESSTAQLGQDGNPAQLVGPGGHVAAQMVIFKPQTLSSAVISVSLPARPGADRHNGPTLAAQGLPAQQPALTGEKGPSMHPAPCESQSPGSSHRQDPAAQAVPELKGLGCKGCRNMRTSHPPPPQAASKQSVWG